MLHGRRKTTGTTAPGAEDAGQRTIIEVLNEVLTAELTPINQYFVDAKMCANWGYDRLAEHEPCTPVCVRRVTDRCVQAAIAAGARDPETLARSSRAGTGCGGCWSTVEAMLVAAGNERVGEPAELSPSE